MNIALRSAVVLALAALTFAAQAAPITYTFTGTGTGVLNGAAFTDAALTFTALGDTLNVGSDPGGFEFFVPVTATVAVSGFASDTLSQTLRVFSVPSNGNVGLSQDGPDVFDVNSPALLGYELTTEIGPLATTAFGNPGRSFNTSRGTFRLDTIGAAGTFTASLQPVPEPASLAALGLGAVAVLRRRKRA